MESFLNLTSNSYLYKITKSLSKKQITQIAGEVSKRKKNRFIRSAKCVEKKFGGKTIKYSLFVFELAKEPTFLVKSRLVERTYGYLLIVEYNNYLIVNSKHALGLKKALETVGEPIDYATLSGFLLTETTSFKRFSMRNTNISSYNTSIRRRTVEAKNLVDSFSPLSASKQLVNSFMINTGEDSNYSISLNTSKISEKQKKISFSEFCVWGIGIIDKLSVYIPNDNYLQNFALPSDKEKLKELTPITIVIDYSNIQEEILNCDKITYITRKGKEKLVSKEIISRLLNRDDLQSFELAKDVSDDKKYFINNDIVKDVYLKKNQKSLKLKSKKLNNLLVYCDGESTTFCEILNEHGQILVNFSNIEYAYTNNELFFDHQMEQSTKSFLSIFHSYEALSKTTSEKGKITENMNSFAKDTVFKFIEDTFSNNDYLICDDLGNEIADYISVKENETIDFYHAKSDHTKKLSASAFHIVVSQALKNLGSIVNVEKMDLKNKEKVWNQPYSTSKIDKVTINIKNGSVSKAVDVIRKTSLAPSTTKRVWLVVDFISKKDLISELENGPKKVTIQIIWLVSSFINDCREMGIQPRIACKP
ncbi:TPA: hypothetical protein ACHJYD_001977 [Enterococcus faecalis]